MSTVRTTLGLPVERFNQLQGLAAALELSPAALVERWIDDAVERGDPGASHPEGYMALDDEGVVFVDIAGIHLPEMNRQRAALLAAVLDGAAGVSSTRHSFQIPTGRAVPVELNSEGSKLTVGRHGRGVVLMLDHNGKQTKFAATPSLVACVARQIWKELEPRTVN